ncbi:MAG: M2 family metallopeptidase [Deltaproteobacteria bacterium]|nr:M2 family metallopeptidase [Deltaproteobacteria bacterium]
MRSIALVAAAALLVCCTSAPEKKPTPVHSEEPTAVNIDEEVLPFLADQTKELEPLAKAANQAWYEASVSGKDEDWEKSKQAEDTLNRYFANTELFAKVKGYRDSGKVKDPLLKRQLDMLYLAMLGKQVDPVLLQKITALQAKVEQTFNAFRGRVDGKEMTQNQINEILRTSTNSRKLQAAWEAQKSVGPAVEPTLKELVALRNQVAQKLGFRDFYALRLAESEYDEKELLALFDQLDQLTKEPFAKAKAEVDARLAKRLKIKPEQLMPWHYQNPFFQQPPDVFKTGLEEVYQKQDVLKLCRTFYSGIGLDVEDILQRSDLYEKKGKSPHAFSSDIDRSGDVRVLANIVPGAEWMGTMMHELGHATYSKYIDRGLPWLLRNDAHALTTEGIAMLMEQLAGNPYWVQAMGLIDEKKRDQILPEAKLERTFAPLQFSRWTQVMLRFERELYRDPSQDLNALWWQMVEQYQLLKRPPDRNAPDYASKIHFVAAPVYYHNYQMGELFLSQLQETVAKLQDKDTLTAVYVGDTKVGEFLKAEVFAVGARYPWNELTRRVTGAPLSAEAFARRFAQ